MSDDYENDDDKPEGKVIKFPNPDDKFTNITEYVEHPLEDVFDIEQGSTVIEYRERIPAPLGEYEPYDDKDKELEEQFQEVYSIALTTFDNAQENIDGLEPKYIARAHEVASGYLNIALAAAKEKKELKQSKDKLEKLAKAAKAGGNTTNILVSHSDILDMVKDMKIPSFDDYLEGEVIDPDPPT